MGILFSEDYSEIEINNGKIFHTCIKTAGKLEKCNSFTKILTQKELLTAFE